MWRLVFAAALVLSTPAFSQPMPADHDMPSEHDMSGHQMSGHDMPTPDKETMDMHAMDMPEGPSHGGAGNLGGYPMTRDGSGTSWLPDATPHQGLHLMRGPWTVMAHATLNAVYDRQQGPRGDSQAFASGMAMVSGRRALGGEDQLVLRFMLSPDPLMGKRGYPLLLATGETADGRTPLVDRQHPHDLFMEASATLTHAFSDQVSAFVYAGLPGEPAFGPPAFMHRPSIHDSPEAPVSHHWLDSTHITFGVLTAGLVRRNWKLEASRFHGREPDQHRYDIETGSLDSTAVRLSWNPAPQLALQGSWAEVKSPEALEPDQNQRKWSASLIHTRPWGEQGSWSSTLAWGRRTSPHGALDAWIAESTLRPNPDWTVFARAERVENNELDTAHHGDVHVVTKVSVGAVRDWALSDHMAVGLGALYAVNRIPAALKPAYADRPDGAMAFIRLRLR